MNTLSEPFDESGEDFVSRRGVSLSAVIQGEIIQLVPIGLELGNVGLGKVDMLWVECFEIPIEKLLGDLIVKWMLAIMIAFEQSGGQVGHGSVEGARAERFRGSGLGRLWRGGFDRLRFDCFGPPQHAHWEAAGQQQNHLYSKWSQHGFQTVQISTGLTECNRICSGVEADI